MQANLRFMCFDQLHHGLLEARRARGFFEGVVVLQVVKGCEGSFSVPSRGFALSVNVRSLVPFLSGFHERRGKRREAGSH